MFQNHKKWPVVSTIRWLALLTVAFVASTAKAEDGVQALSVRLSQPDGKNRIEVEISEPLGFQVFTLDAPRRVVIDLPRVEWRVQPPRAGAAMRFVDAVRFGMFKADASRMVIDLRRAANVEAAYLRSEGTAHFLVIDLAAESASDFARAAGWPTSIVEQKTEEAPSDAMPSPKKRPNRGIIVAIDPGHGGIDPGASYGRIYEKELVLEYAFALAKSLNEIPGFVPFLTRKDDSFLSLRERVSVSRHANADILISIHADALEKGVASGATVFTLSDEASDEEAADLVRSHNRADIIAGVRFDETPDDVAQVLVDLSRRSTDVASEQLATEIVRQLETFSQTFSSRSLQSAGFRVLKAPDVPSVLVEIGFLSSEKDRERLISESGRKAVIKALTEAILNWAARQPGDKYSAIRSLRN
ncbi:MAG: N-acetylmuramoyl-L-alanine amidase [Pikeienuella sp.]